MVVSQAALNSVTTFYTCLVFREDEHFGRTTYAHRMNTVYEHRTKNPHEYSVILRETFRGLL
jgi:hypothetical protein